MRYDFVLIWGHGLQYQDDIIALCARTTGFEIVKIISYEPPDLPVFVQTVYSHDYAPFEHLVEKTRYLLSTPSKVVCVFLKNYFPDEDYKGEGSFRHIESKSLRKLKDQIRDLYNPYLEGKRTEHHVIHTSDSEGQSDHMLKLFGHQEGIAVLKQIPNKYLSVPHHLPFFDHFSIKKVSINSIYCNVFFEESKHVRKKRVPLSHSPQAKFLQGNRGEYSQYLQKFSGIVLTDFYSLAKFEYLARNLNYLLPPFHTNYVVLFDNGDNSYTILDGLHRAAILLHREYLSIVAVIVK